MRLTGEEVAYHVQGRRVQEAIAMAPRSVQVEFEVLMKALVEDPRPSNERLDILPLREDLDTDVFTVPFNDGLLVYRILPLVDYRTIRLMAVVWLTSQ